MIAYNSINDIVSYLVARLEQDPRVNLHDSPITVSIENDKVFVEVGLMTSPKNARRSIPSRGGF